MQQGSAVDHLIESYSAAPPVSEGRRRLGVAVFWLGTLVLAGTAVIEVLYKSGRIAFGWDTWRPVLYAYVLWSAMLCVSQVLRRGEDGKKALFVLPAILFIGAIVIFPLLFGLYIAFTDWNLASL
ncbi:MAG: sugar ABC transporter permease, partial [Rhizobiaceae bacterium]